MLSLCRVMMSTDRERIHSYVFSLEITNVCGSKGGQLLRGKKVAVVMGARSLYARSRVKSKKEVRPTCWFVSFHVYIKGG